MRAISNGEKSGVNNGCVSGVRNEARINAVEGDLSELKSCVSDIKRAMGEIKDSMAQLRLDVVHKMAARPTWAVTIIISFLSSLSLGLLVYVVTSAIKGGP